ncbi:MAG: NAD(+)/NADH kinase [Acidobacteriota bacterium]
MERVMVVAKRHRRVARDAVRRVLRLLADRGVTAWLDPETARSLGRRGAARALGGTGRPADLYVVIGGDGTLLSVARATADRPRPILGVNLGGLGFLTETSLEEMEGSLAAVLDGRFDVDRRMALEVSLRRARRTVARRSVLNDVVINKGALARIIDMELSIDRSLVTTYKADGLIVSTPTGSTAYSLSAGGPIIHPNLDALLIAPICPHTLTMRPLVVSERSRVEIVLRTDNAETYLTLDGQVGFPMKVGDRVSVRRSRSPVLMVRSRRKDYFELLRHKLHWGER